MMRMLPLRCLTAWWHRVMLVALAVLSVLATSSSVAHELSMAELQLRELTPGEFALQWSAGEKSAPADSLTPVWPAHCRVQGQTLRCGEQGLTGSLSVKGVGERFSAVLVKVSWLNGPSRVYTLSAGQRTVQLFGAADDNRGVSEVASAYGVLGLQHILSGIDHLLFVIGLLFLVGFQRRLVWTITAFTVAHSITLALGALHLLTLRSPPVEATIALSIMLVAGEALRQRQTLARRWPALVAFLFGLVHGLGFAGALEEVGLPQNHLAVALLTFNVGVELGQLLVVGAAFVLWRALSGWPAFQRLRTPSLYAIGSMAAYWTVARVVAIGG
jgi:hydrogenase/urease accessory protein HupE